MWHVPNAHRYSLFNMSSLCHQEYGCRILSHAATMLPSVTPNDRLLWEQDHNQEGAGGCNAPTRNFHNIKVKRNDQTAKKMCNCLPHLHGVSWTNVVRENSLSKVYVYAIRSVGCYSTHYAIKVLILWSWQRISIIWNYIHTEICMYIYALAL